MLFFGAAWEIPVLFLDWEKACGLQHLGVRHVRTVLPGEHLGPDSEGFEVEIVELSCPNGVGVIGEFVETLGRVASCHDGKSFENLLGDVVDDRRDICLGQFLKQEQRVELGLWFQLRVFDQILDVVDDVALNKSIEPTPSAR